MEGVAEGGWGGALAWAMLVVGNWIGDFAYLRIRGRLLVWLAPWSCGSVIVGGGIEIEGWW